MLYFIGLGLGDAEDITVKGLKAVQKCDRVFLEHYTAILMVDHHALEELYGKKVELADREMVESEADVILNAAKEGDAAFLVVGDVFAATTHSDLVLRAKEMEIPVKVIHNASIMNAVSCCGLQLYSFGQSVSIVFFTDSWRPDSFYDKIKVNRDCGMHTLCLLDIKVKEQSIENMARGRKVYEPPRYMTVNQCVEQLLEIEETRQEGVYTPDSLAIGMARVGTDTQKIVAGTLQELLDIDFGEPLHSLVLPSKEIHELEGDMVSMFLLPGSKAKFTRTGSGA